MKLPTILKNPYPKLAALEEAPAARPENLWLVPTTRCNTQCTHCWHAVRPFGEDMGDDVFEHVREQLLDDAKHIDLVGYGEPFIARRFHHMLDECLKRGQTVNTITNGLALRDEQLAAKIVRLPITLCLSIDGARPETYEYFRPGIGWEKLTQALEVLERSARAAGAEARHRLEINFVAIKKNIGDLPELVRLAARYGVSEIHLLPLAHEEYFEAMQGQCLMDAPELARRPLQEARRLARRHGIALSGSRSLRRLITESAGAGNGRAPRLKRLWRRGAHLLNVLRERGLARVFQLALFGLGPRAKTGVGFCLRPWDSTYIETGGAVYACCITGDSLGSLRDDSFADIWSGALYRSLRRTIHSWNPTRLCRYCTMHSGINGGDQDQYHRCFANYRRQELPLDAPGVIFADGFHPLERDQTGAPQHSWMRAQGRLELPPPNGARFLRLEIYPLTPGSVLNPGRGRINGGAWEPFDNSCPDLTFPLDGVREPKIILDLEMENIHRAEGDPRELALAIHRISYLY